MFCRRIIMLLFTFMQLEMELAQYTTPALREMVNGDKECAEDDTIDLDGRDHWISYAEEAWLNRADSADYLFLLGCKVACFYQMMGVLKNNCLQKQRLSTLWNYLISARLEKIDEQVNVMTACFNALGDTENRCNTGVKVLLCGFIAKLRSTKDPVVDLSAYPGRQVLNYNTDVDVPIDLYLTDNHIYVSSKTTCIGKTLLEDNFNKFDNQKWRNTIKISSQEDEEFVVYNNKKENFYFSDGKLYIRPTLMNDHEVVSGSLNLKKCTGYYGSTECKRTAESYNILPPVFSAQITSKISFKYGIIEIRAKLPQGDWIVPQSISFIVDGAIIKEINTNITFQQPIYNYLQFSKDEIDSTWPDASYLSPFDKDFHITFGVAVGGAREFPDSSTTKNNHKKPWINYGSIKRLLNFWQDRENWYKTWNEEESALQIDHIKVTTLP
ncbi:beta-1,3-glucan-binding protein 1-like isoform X3 [Lycorma delicatula]|uniref:beta-1,3-glucan-binding protein 1-like isoform X3 n=1 Tax=Lycorma delicatula TaxID=130591 RepID=UPI003F5103DC